MGHRMGVRQSSTDLSHQMNIGNALPWHCCGVSLAVPDIVLIGTIAVQTFKVESLNFIERVMAASGLGLVTAYSDGKSLRSSVVQQNRAPNKSIGHNQQLCWIQAVAMCYRP